MGISSAVTGAIVTKSPRDCSHMEAWDRPLWICGILNNQPLLDAGPSRTPCGIPFEAYWRTAPVSKALLLGGSSFRLSRGNIDVDIKDVDGRHRYDFLVGSYYS